MTVDGDGRLSMATIDGDGRLSMATIASDSDDYGRRQWQWMVMTMVGDQRRVAMVTTGKGNATVMETGRKTTTPSSKNC